MSGVGILILDPCGGIGGNPAEAIFLPEKRGLDVLKHIKTQILIVEPTQYNKY